MVVKIGAKSSTERTPLRRLSSLEKKGGRKTVKELKSLDADKAVAPHYQRPTANSSNQSRVQFKPLTQSPSPHFNKGRRFSLGLESPDACKYVRKSSLLGSRTSEKSPVKINRLKSCKSLEKTPVKINGLKPSKSPGLLKIKTPKSDLCCKTLNLARDTCSSNCKHVVKGGDLTVSPEPRCPYHYCSLNHLDRVEPPSVKQFLASRRRLLRTQKSFKWVGLTPVPKGSGVGTDSGGDRGHGVDTDIVIDTGHGVDIDSVVDTGQGLFVVGYGDNRSEEDAVEVGNKSDDDPRLEDCQIVECEDYDDDGLLFESYDSHGNDGIPIDEILMDESEVKVEVEDSMDLFAGDEDVEIDTQEIHIEAIAHDGLLFESDDSHGNDGIPIDEILMDESEVKMEVEESMDLFGGGEDVEIDKQKIDIEAIDHDMAGNSYDYDQLAESLVDASDDKMRADESMEVFAEDEDGEDADFDLDVEAFVYLQIAESLVDNNDVKVKAEESFELFAEDTDVKDDNHGIDVEAYSNNLASNCHDYGQTEERQVNVLESECNQTEPDSLLEVLLSGVNSCLQDKEKEEDNCNLLSFEGELVSEVCTNDPIEQFVVCEDDSDQSEEIELQCYIPVNHGTECSSLTESDCTPGVSLSMENKYLEDVVEEEYDCSSGSLEGLFVSGVCANDHTELSVGCKDDYDRIEDPEPLCFIQVNIVGPECNSSTEPDGLPDASLSEANSSLKGEVKEEDEFSGSSECGSVSDDCDRSEVNSYLQDKVKEEDNCNLQSFEDGSVSEACTIDPIEQFVVCQNDSDQSVETELQYYIPVNHGTEGSSPTDSDHTPGVSFSLENKYLEDVVEEEYDCSSGSLEGLSVSGVCANDHIELSVGCKDDYDQIENPEPRCFIQVNVDQPECSSSTESDGLPDASLSEAISSHKGEVKEEDECISESSECGSVSDDSDQSEETELQCYIPVNHETECSNPTEPDCTPGVLFSLENKSLEDVGEEEYDCSSGSVEGLFAAELCPNDHLELSVGCENDYDQIEDPEARCFIRVNVFGSDCNSSTELDGPPDAALSEPNLSLKVEVKEENGRFSGSSECGFVSGVSAYDLIEQSASCQDVCDQSEDTEQQCFVLVNALEFDCRSQRDSNGLCNVLLSEENSCPKNEAKEEHDNVSGSSGDETASEVNIDGHTKQFVGWEDDQGANGRSGNEISELDSNKCGEVDSACSEDGNLNCHIQVGTFGVQCSNAEVDSPQKSSVLESGEGTKQVIKEECIDIAGSILDGFDDEYNLTSLFAECKDDSTGESVSNFAIQFNILTDVDSSIDKSPSDEFSINSKFDEGEDAHTLAGGEDGCAIETHGDDFEEQYLESENTTNEISRTNSDFDNDYIIDPELYNEMKEEFCDISRNSLIAVPECENLKSGLKGYKIISEENKNKPYRLKFRQGRAYPFDNQISEAEKVDLRHQMTEERRAAHEWMLDYALTNIVKKLSPFRQRKVELLVEAFETVTPLSKCETNDLPHGTRAFTCSRPIQACN